MTGVRAFEKRAEEEEKKEGTEEDSASTDARHGARVGLFASRVRSGRRVEKR